MSSPIANTVTLGARRAALRGTALSALRSASEWTATCWDSVPGADDSAHANCGSRAVRGGSWDTSADGIGFADAEPASREGDDRGLRLLREL